MEDGRLGLRAWGRTADSGWGGREGGREVLTKSLGRWCWRVGWSRVVWWDTLGCFEAKVKVKGMRRRRREEREFGFGGWVGGGFLWSHFELTGRRFGMSLQELCLIRWAVRWWSRRW